MRDGILHPLRPLFFHARSFPASYFSIGLLLHLPIPTRPEQIVPLYKFEFAAWTGSNYLHYSKTLVYQQKQRFNFWAKRGNIALTHVCLCCGKGSLCIEIFSPFSVHLLIERCFRRARAWITETMAKWKSVINSIFFIITPVRKWEEWGEEWNPGSGEYRIVCG